MSGHISLDVIQSQVSKLTSTLEELKQANQEIWHKLSQQSEYDRKSEEFVKKANELHANLQVLEEREEKRVNKLVDLEGKVINLGEKVEHLCSVLQSNQQVTTVQPTEAGQIPIRIKKLSGSQAQAASENDGQSVANSGNGTRKSKHANRNKRHDVDDYDERGNVKNEESKKAAGYKPSLTEKLLKEEMKESRKRQFLPLNELGLRHKETEMDVDNRVRVLSKVQCVPGEVMQGKTRKYRTPLTEDTPSKNNLPTRQEVLAMRKLGTKPKQRSSASSQRPKSRNEFKNLAGLMRDPEEVPDIRDMNSWRSMAEAERVRGLVSDGPKDERGMDTCLLLDISESMQGGAFDEMIKMALHYVNGIEEISKVLNLVENIGVATFGHYTGVVQHMTSDYQKVRATLNMLTPGGSTPMSAGLYMGLACCLGNKSDSPAILSKVIMFTDGKATSDIVIQSDADDPPSNNTEKLMIHLALTESSKDIGKRDIRVYCYPIGCENDTFIKIITENTDGTIFRGDDIHKLIRMSQTTRLALELKDNLPDAEGFDSSFIKQMWKDLGMPLDKDFDEAIDLAKFFRKKLKSSDSSEGRYAESDDSDLPPLGTRVRRGPDWSWGNQDSGGPGTVVGHTKGQVWVEWDSGHLNVYKYHAVVGYDVLIVQEPRILKSDELIAVGCLVQRGDNWRYKEQDGGVGNVGTVIKVNKDATVVVRWPNKQKAVYKYGKDGYFEVKICEPSNVYGNPGNQKTHVWGSGQQLGDGTEQQPDTASKDKPEPESEDQPTVSPSVDEMNKKNTRKVVFAIDVQWSYEKDDIWHPYPDDINLKIEKAFQRKSQRCIVEMDNEIFQVAFKKMVQICEKTGTITQVRRVDKSGITGESLD